ncbi:MAG: ABC transporter substrate-binding protein [Lachnospiraceae bacterium]|nr:ABC transporter substrate-binding protein [Lachnospiraceae bacterium]
MDAGDMAEQDDAAGVNSTEDEETADDAAAADSTIAADDTESADNTVAADDRTAADNDADEDDGTDADNTSAAADTGDRNYPSGEDWCGLTWESSLELLYAEQFTVDYYEGGYARIVIADEDVFLVVPEDAETPAGLEDNVTVLQQPIANIYLVATSAMDFFVSLDSLDAIRLSGTNASGWYIEEAQEAMEAGDILYAGKYSAPDYELILAEGCGLAIESTMIYHNPEVQEKLESFGIPVLVERSSYEPHPMGRTEWMKLYAVLLGLEDEAEEIFNEQVASVQAVASEEALGKTVAFFYITSAGTANVRKSNDYVAEMIELAGGTYVFDDLGEDDSALSTVNMTMEEFYAQAYDADYIIYNSTIDGELYTMDELLGKSALLSDFTAVQNGNVWCTGKNLFQETTSLGDLIVEIHTILSDEDVDESELQFLHRIAE